MNKIPILLLCFMLGFISCKNSEKEMDKLEITKTYYDVLDTSDHTKIAALLTDSLLTRETEYDYEQTFSLNEYVEWLKWDGVFGPTYEILQMEQVGEVVKARVSKTDKRIEFLHEGPIVTDHTFHFENGRIISIETTKYVTFNDSLFVQNRETFLEWVKEIHPEIKSFIHDQTESGGKRYLKAIELYKNKE